MSVSLPLVLVLGVVAWLVVKFFRLRWWAVLALVLFGFYLAGTIFAPLIDDTTRSGVDAVNHTTK
ncbi:hypothetical protein LO771_07870 [Streptacidiphilus sp. ASG 303]|uniref:hypothetical protein n=1 Tax=Streptacidiphilus sp. ASG 303 TaxID=2896847 RepID=UPI001E46FDFF|nr:hypothetical protein [Streptacidiphilus sp. ASG 303]MCD0482331.1 hypothetical protein [Streptacidiphilus sp. ASG 303]